MNSNVIDQVIQLRRKLGLSQSEFARRFGLPFQTYAQWERGRRQPDTSALMLLNIIVIAPHTVSHIVRQNKRRPNRIVLNRQELAA